MENKAFQKPQFPQSRGTLTAISRRRGLTAVNNGFAQLLQLWWWKINFPYFRFSKMEKEATRSRNWRKAAFR